MTPLAIEVSPAITSTMLEPIVELVSSNIAIIMPVGIALFGIMIGLRLVPRIINMYSHG